MDKNPKPIGIIGLEESDVDPPMTAHEVIIAEIDRIHLQGGSAVPEATATSHGVVKVTAAQSDPNPSTVYSKQKVDELIDTYTHVQSEAAAEWVIQHNLGKHPSVTVVDSSKRVVIGEIEYKDENELKIVFRGAFSGKAFLN